MPFLHSGCLNHWKKKRENIIYFPAILRHFLNRMLCHFRLLPVGFICQDSLRHNSYFSKFWINRYSLCYPTLCLKLSSWQNKDEISGSDLLQKRIDKTHYLASPQGQNMNVSLSSPSITFSVYPLVSCLSIQGDSFCYCSSSEPMTALHVFGTVSRAAGDDSDTSH